MQGAIPVDKQLFKNLFISLHTGSDENEIVRFQTTGLKSYPEITGVWNKTREIDFTPIPGPILSLPRIPVAKPGLDRRAALSDFREKSKPELK